MDDTTPLRGQRKWLGSITICRKFLHEIVNSLAFFIYISFSFFVSVCSSMCVCVSLSLFRPPLSYLSFFISLYIFLCLFTSLCLCMSLSIVLPYLSLFTSLSLSLCLFISRCLSLSFRFILSSRHCVIFKDFVTHRCVNKPVVIHDQKPADREIRETGLTERHLYQR